MFVHIVLSTLMFLLGAINVGLFLLKNDIVSFCSVLKTCYLLLIGTISIDILKFLKLAIALGFCFSQDIK